MVFVCGLGMEMALLVIFVPGRRRNEKLKHVYVGIFFVFVLGKRRARFWVFIFR